MESPYRSPVHEMDPSRPSIGFPLGTALLLIVIFTLSGVFSCCYHWEKLRSLRRSSSRDVDVDGEPSKLKPDHMGSIFEENQSLPVIMAGDKEVKFIALPCPCQPPRLENIAVELPKPPKAAPLPPMAAPLY